MVNPALRNLGFGPDDRIVIVHADDVGMCHAANVAFWETLPFGIVTCGSVMMPCPWVPEMAAWCRRHPQADVGVHITLLSDSQRYRWGPLSTRDPASGLLDPEGYLWMSNEQLYAHMDPAAAAAEMRAQIEMALAIGIDVTHLDTHSGTVLHPQLFAAYVQAAVEYQVPAMLPRIPESRMAEFGIEPAVGRALLHELDTLAASGYPVLDHFCAVQDAEDHLMAYKRLFDSVPAGITHLALHPAAPGSDIEVLAASASHRIADYQTFLRPELKAYVTDQGIHLLGYRALRELIRGGAQVPAETS